MLRPCEWASSFVRKHLCALLIAVVMISLALSAFLVSRKFITVSDGILFLTLLALLWYAWETKRIREIGEEPVLLLYIRDIAEDIGESDRARQNQYIFRTMSGMLAGEVSMGGQALSYSDRYIFRLRNVGSGAAFNLDVQEESKEFIVSRYQSRFFAPHSDEQSILVESTGRPVNEPGINGRIFDATCESVNGKRYSFRYRIVDILERRVERIA